PRHGTLCVAAVPPNCLFHLDFSCVGDGTVLLRPAGTCNRAAATHHCSKGARNENADARARAGTGHPRIDEDRCRGMARWLLSICITEGRCRWSGGCRGKGWRGSTTEGLWVF